MGRIRPAILVIIGVAGSAVYAAANVLGGVQVSGNGSDGFTCSVVLYWGSALAPGVVIGLTAGLIFWLVLAIRRTAATKGVWWAAVGVVLAAALAAMLLFPPTEWGAPQECPRGASQQE